LVGKGEKGEEEILTSPQGPKKRGKKYDGGSGASSLTSFQELILRGGGE